MCSLFNALFIHSFKLICIAHVIDCKHRPQWRHQQIYHSTVPYGRGIWEKESIIGVQWFQKPRVHRSVGNSASLVSHWKGGPSGWDFCPHWTPMMDTIYPTLTLIIDSFSCSLFILKYFEYTEMHYYMMMLLWLNSDVTCWLCLMSSNTTNVQPSRDRLGKITWVR